MTFEKMAPPLKVRIREAGIRYSSKHRSIILYAFFMQTLLAGRKFVEFYIDTKKRTVAMKFYINGPVDGGYTIKPSHIGSHSCTVTSVEAVRSLQRFGYPPDTFLPVKKQDEFWVVQHPESDS